MNLRVSLDQHGVIQEQERGEEKYFKGLYVTWYSQTSKMIRPSLVVKLRLFLSMCSETLPECDVSIPLHSWVRNRYTTWVHYSVLNMWKSGVTNYSMDNLLYYSLAEEFLAVCHCCNFQSVQASEWGCWIFPNFYVSTNRWRLHHIFHFPQISKSRD